MNFIRRFSPDGQCMLDACDFVHFHMFGYYADKAALADIRNSLDIANFFARAGAKSILYLSAASLMNVQNIPIFFMKDINILISLEKLYRINSTKPGGNAAYIMHHILGVDFYDTDEPWTHFIVEELLPNQRIYDPLSNFVRPIHDSVASKRCALKKASGIKIKVSMEGGE